MTHGQKCQLREAGALRLSFALSPTGNQRDCHLLFLPHFISLPPTSCVAMGRLVSGVQKKPELEWPNTFPWVTNFPLRALTTRMHDIDGNAYCVGMGLYLLSQHGLQTVGPLSTTQTTEQVLMRPYPRCHKAKVCHNLCKYNFWSPLPDPADYAVCSPTALEKASQALGGRDFTFPNTIHIPSKAHRPRLFFR